MSEKELIDKIKKIIFSVPGEIYKFSPPEDCFAGEWEEASMKEKAFLLIEELFLNLNREKVEQKDNDDCNNYFEVEISRVPRFYSVADENMFFEALNSIPSIRKVKGSGKGLFLYFKPQISSDEMDFLKCLLKRYQVLIPPEIANTLTNKGDKYERVR